MKKLICLLGLILSLSFSYGQFPITQNLGNNSTLVQVPANGGFKANLINRSYTDTTQANLGYIDYYGGAMIYTTSDSSLWLRNTAGTKWDKVYTSGGTGTTPNLQLVTDAGNTTTNNLVVNSGLGTLTRQSGSAFEFKNTNNNFEHNISVPTVTANRSAYLQDTTGTIAYLHNITTPTWQQVLTAGSTLTQSNSVIMDGNSIDFTGTESEDFVIQNTGGFSAQNINGQIVLSNIGDTIKINPYLGQLLIDTLTSAVGTKAMRYNPTTGLVSYADTTTGGGTTPTWQQTLTAGSTLTGDNTIDGGGFGILWNNFIDYEIIGASSFNAQIKDVTDTSIIGINAGRITLDSKAGSTQSTILITKDSINIQPYTGKFYIDTLTSAVGTKALRYNPTSGLVSYADTTAGGGSTPTWQQTLTAGSTLTGDNTINGGNYELILNNISNFEIYTSAAFNVAAALGGASLSGENSTIAIADSISIQPYLGNLKIDTLTSAVGTKALRYNPTSGLVSYADTTTGGGATPTLQQVLTAGSTLNQNNTIDANGNSLYIDNADELFINGSNTSITATLGLSLVNTSAGVRSSNITIQDSIQINPYLGNLKIDTLTSAVGTKALRYNPTSGLVSYADTTAGGGGDWTRTGNYLYPTSLTDSIGIGTSAPTVALDVVGNAKILGQVTVKDNGVNYPMFQVLNPSDDVLFSVNNDDPFTRIRTSETHIDNTAHDVKVGINTSTPTVALDVVGAIKNTDTVVFAGLSTGIPTGAQRLLIGTDNKVYRADTTTAGGGGISGLTTNELVYGNSATTIASLPVATYPSLTELSYVKGLTSNAQTQIDGKWGTLGTGGTISGTNYLGTSDNKSMFIRTNATNAMKIDSNQNLQVGTFNNTMSSTGSLVIGNGSTANFQSIIVGSGHSGFSNYQQIFGSNQAVYNDRGFAQGISNIVVGSEAAAFGRSNYTRAAHEFSLGYYGTDYTATGSLTDRLFNIGASQDGGTTRKNAMTILRDGRIGIGIRTSTAAASAVLDIESTTQGLLIPRMTTTQQNAIATPATGLIIWNTDTLGLVNYTGSAWLKVSQGGGITVGTTTITSGTDTRVPFNDGGVYGEDANFSYNKTDDYLILNGANSTGNIKIGPLATAPAYGAIYFGKTTPSTTNWSFLGSTTLTAFNTAFGDNLEFRSGNVQAATLTGATWSLGYGGAATANTAVTINVANAAYVPLKVKGQSAQTADLLQVTDVSSNPYFMIGGAGSVGIGLATAAASSLVDITSTTKGLLIPRMTNTQMAAISAPATGLMVFNTDSATLHGYNGSNWQKYLTANSAGSVGIGTTTPSSTYKLDIVSSASALRLSSTSYTPSTLVISDPDGSMLITNSQIYAASQQLQLNANSSSISFQTGGTPKMFINTNANTGNVGIGTITPSASAKLDLTSTTQGLLIPRMTTTQQNAIATPATGLIIWNTDTLGLVNYTGSAWLKVSQGGGSGEVNTASNLGGGLANYDSKVGTDLRFNSFAAADFDLASNLISIDATKWLTISAAAAAYQPLDADLTTWAGITPAANVGTFLATPSSANLRSAVTDENGTGALLFSGATSPDFTTSVTVGGVAVPTISSTNTLTNKRITMRTGTVASSATPTINTDDVDLYTITAQTVDITSMTTNLSGTPTEGQLLTIEITGTASRAITWGASFAAGLTALPTTTSGTSTLGTVFIRRGSLWVIKGTY